MKNEVEKIDVSDKIEQMSDEELKNAMNQLTLTEIDDLLTVLGGEK